MPEPEAAGAIAWILYSAYRETGQERYRIGAEQALAALERQGQNPSYELQLPYGTLAAARDERRGRDPTSTSRSC